ncbi:Zn-ribbon domain-containing OB-fold protein [Caenimonas aquaedulcis]|uniref:OB-fold domain-containing protein n=1 Tax=Caenimonas aquaedulcis TaxID=2793270 RepID=A0A931H3K9_9BURK|nr:OB-fold domain-containing protein [Caenimonas aquaedulcis]MBG9387984.1 OB-fold domain-containing protein [Caenimonas aquaedulcis]
MEFPKPTEDAVNREMLQAWHAHGELLLQHCTQCAAVTYYPRRICPSCWSSRMENRPSAGEGTVISFSVVHRGVDEAFRQLGTTVTLASVRTDDGPQLITLIVGDDRDQVAIGGRVRLARDADRERYPLPVYSLAPSGKDAS